MEIITWQDEYSVNVKEIDDQHKHFIGILNRLYMAIQASDTAVLSPLIDELVAYATKHFATEEKYFDQFHYEGATEHKEEHAKLAATVAESLARKTEDPLTLSYELLDFLEDWLVNHLNTMDKKYVTCFAEHGLA